MVTPWRHSRLSSSIQIELIKYFYASSISKYSKAKSSGNLTEVNHKGVNHKGVNRNTAVLFFQKIRKVIFAEPEALSPPQMRGEIEVDESGGRRKGKCKRGAAGKVPVIGSRETVMSMQ